MKSYIIIFLTFFLGHYSFAKAEVNVTIQGEVNQKAYKDILSTFNEGVLIYVDGYLSEKLPPKMEVYKIRNDAGIFKVSFRNSITKEMNLTYNFHGIGYSSHTLKAKYICPELKCKLQFYGHGYERHSLIH